jgi:cytochrome c5
MAPVDGPFVFDPDDDDRGPRASGGGNGGSDDVTYADVAPVLETNCLGCHSDPPSGAPFSLASYDEAASRADRIVARAVDGVPSAMPPHLDDAEAMLLVEWAEAGAPG